MSFPSVHMSEHSNSPSFTDSSGGHVVSPDGREFVLKSCALRVRARGGLGRVVLEQRFENPHPDSLQVSYTMPLPSDGAVSGFSFETAGKRTVGEVDRRAKARERYEDAILEGRAAALLDQERSSVFTQEIGNIPPHSELIVEITIDQRLRWLADGQWEWRFPTVVGPRYMGRSSRVADADAIEVGVDLTAAETGPAASLSLRIEDRVEGTGPESPSHALQYSNGEQGVDVGFRLEQGVALDRDVVVRWHVARGEPGMDVAIFRPAPGHARSEDAFGLLSVIPPGHHSESSARVSRDLIFLIDTSGSMSGEPLAQAAKIVTAMIETLRDTDRLELIEFSGRPRAWKRKPVAATKDNRSTACRWVKGLRSGGATEMREGIIKALRPLSDESQRQVVLITDGWIGFESEIVEEISDRLPAASRVHTIGVGHSVNRSLTEPAARAGRGIESIVAPGEDAAAAASRLVKHTEAPLLVNLTLSGEVLRDSVPAALPDLFAGSPALIPLQLAPAGGELLLRAHSANGEWSQRITIPHAEPERGSPAIACMYAREAVEDLEVRRAAGKGGSELDLHVERLGLDFQIATRLTSWVAVSEEQQVDPTQATRKHKVSQALPAGISLDQLGLRAGRGSGPLSSQLMMVGSTGSRRVTAPQTARRGLKSRAGRRTFSPPSKAADSDGDLEDLDLTDIGDALLDSQEDMNETDADSTRLDEELESPIPSVPASEALVARLVRQNDSQLVFEIELTAPLDWRPKRVRLFLNDGSTVDVQIEPAQTTRPGGMQPGQVVRLVVSLSEALPSSPVRMQIERKRRTPFSSCPTLELEIR